uniref:G-protein coupled receptors family 1 profile domain-containing protein n=1 Tax=Ditylenchus dipsaci TaxID=166011 RepID=A0A915DC55_9BILA
MGFERFLFVTYPLWFKSIRVRRGPIIVFTLMFATMSAAVGYTNSLFVGPEEKTHFTCELTWAFGDNYGWCQSFFIIVPQVLGCLFNSYASWFVSRNCALLHFGNNRTKLSSEKRKIRKAKPILWTSTISSICPQIGLIVLRLYYRWHMQSFKLLVSQLFLGKCLANLLVYHIMAKRNRGILYQAKEWMKRRSKRRVDPNESVTSISYYVG